MTNSERVRRLAAVARARRDGARCQRGRGVEAIEADWDAIALDCAADALEREEAARGAEPLYIRREGLMTLAGAPIKSRVQTDSGWMMPAELARRLRATAAKLEADDAG